jgi:catechol 2,3-dioxygenase-like lactoylglutathione lyase family enzyme
LFEGVPPTDHGEFHIGVSLPSGDAVRARRDDLLALGAREVEWSDEPGYVSIKVRDPDGYVVEIAWDEKHPHG